MSKFNLKTLRRNKVQSPVTSETQPAGRTFEGGSGYVRDAKSELFLLAVTNMVGEHTFYESAPDRDGRFVQLVHEVTLSDPKWTARLIGWLRRDAHLRSASVVAAAEFVRARLGAGLHGGNRAVISSALERADEPGEILAYWIARHGRSIPKPVKRGVADAAVRLYSERSLLKWDSDSRDVRFGDVLELTHASPSATWQGELFRHAIDRRQGRENTIPTGLRMLTERAALAALPPEDRRTVLRTPERLSAAGMTWESLAGWLQGPMDAAAWQAVIPSMGYMALLRNLRNFDEAGIPDHVAEQVATRIADPGEVAKSRQLPMRFLAAYRNAPSLRWGHALERALGASLSAVPSLPGRTLVLVDRSGSMFYSRVSARSELTRADAAAVFGTVLAARAERANLVEFGSDSRFVPFKHQPVLRVVDSFGDLGGTDTASAVRKHYRDHDRVVIVTDEQAAWGDPTRHVPADVPVYTWNVAGYRHGHGPTGSANRHTFGGLSDAGFSMIPLLEGTRDGEWPF
ncbi:TROVE domain-containing protein [Rhodococcus opacus]|uniref:TROVE domain-containing protein n=1 Tax=Rhodococcus opacus TaxID=37919 RepID=A0A2S8J9R5_RHOOP|nr:TROVE domain-containing protein [Rhodococcus opacus]PQP23786.1 TROVE domain-containing protein [Rhodococcus opacus]